MNNKCKYFSETHKWMPIWGCSTVRVLVMWRSVCLKVLCVLDAGINGFKQEDVLVVGGMWCFWITCIMLVNLHCVWGLFMQRSTGCWGPLAFLCVYVMLDSCFSIQNICEVLGLWVTVGQHSKVSRLISLSLHQASPWSSSRCLPLKTEIGCCGAARSEGCLTNLSQGLTSGGSFKWLQMRSSVEANIAGYCEMWNCYCEIMDIREFEKQSGSAIHVTAFICVYISSYIQYLSVFTITFSDLQLCIQNTWICDCIIKISNNIFSFTKIYINNC